ncbi:ABC transporter substrate-binding protein [Colwellia sp. 12G3]|uniref:ABC transporter substrate-binding protein n=1 Tax=Colwellia sp. 12G3 TaxID=2058299 RepID=UPI000C34C2DE|nr:ABC transporter substrate-binding protein [Colwellia sp. 12G3]PKI16902.1 ABC transporter substrate-binding protein [Colwellia sp. 12G3]
MPTFYLTLLSLLLVTFSAFTVNAKSEKIESAQVKNIKLGMSNALSGPTSDLGKELKKGANTYFSHLNKHGGIHGRSVEIISLDDGYEPHNTVINTKKLIDEQVLALFGYVGTPTSYAIMPIIIKSKIPYLMPFTGADFLRTPVNANIFNLRASYYQEIEAQIEYLITVKKYNKIALVIQADEFGLTAQRAINKILSNKKLATVLTTRYRRNSNDIKAALTQLAAQPLDAVIFVGTYQPFIHLINLAHQQDLDVLFTSLSFIGSHNLLNQIPFSSRVLLSEVMPEPNDCNWQLCQQFITDMRSAGHTELNRIQLEGYLNAFVFSQVAKQCKGNLSRQCLLKQFEQFSYQDNTLNISFRRDNNQGVQQVYFSFSKAIKNSVLTSSLTH